MKIKVLTNFGGVLTKELRILPGIYDEGDERLFGTADYLLEHGFAIAVREETPLTEFVQERPQEDFAFHNEIMAKKGRPENEVDSEPSEPDDPETKSAVHPYETEEPPATEAEPTKDEAPPPEAQEKSAVQPYEPLDRRSVDERGDPDSHWSDAMSLDELRVSLAERGTNEEEVVSDMSAHWKERRAEIVAWLDRPKS